MRHTRVLAHAYSQSDGGDRHGSVDDVRSLVETGAHGPKAPEGIDRSLDSLRRLQIDLSKPVGCPPALQITLPHTGRNDVNAVWSSDPSDSA